MEPPLDRSVGNPASFWDARVATELGVDQWCSSLHWAASVAEAFAPDAERVEACTTTSSVAFVRHLLGDDETALVPFDLVWGFGASALGSRETNGAAEVCALVESMPDRAVFFSGIEEGAPQWRNLVDATGRGRRLLLGEERSRCRASLDGGLDGFLSRRTREFRRNLRQMDRRIRQHPGGLRTEVLDDDDPQRVIDRFVAIEHNSWKGRDDSGITTAEMQTLYRLVAERLRAAGGLRAVVAVDGSGNDIGFILGGVAGDTYRGLQISFVETTRQLGVGNYLQWHEIERLCNGPDRNSVRLYDLGMDIAYKRQWAESTFTTRTLISVR